MILSNWASILCGALFAMYALTIVIEKDGRLKLIILLTFCATVSFGQEFSKKDFKDTYWFTNNLDSLFFEADTISMIKVLDKGP